MIRTPTFPGILAIDLTKVGETRYPLSLVNRLWLPKKVYQSGKLITNPTDCVVAIKLATGGNDGTPWGLSDGLMNSLSGEFTDLLVTVLTPGASQTLYLQTANGLVAGYASTDGLSPTVSSGASDFSGASGPSGGGPGGGGSGTGYGGGGFGGGTNGPGSGSNVN